VKGREGLLFVNKKKQKNFIYAGPWALSVAEPMTQRSKIFAPLFLKSGRFLLSGPRA
jgi:hypothetical protein